MSRPLCSVVLATYNRAHLLARSLACYANQDFPKDEFELVVIDDSSTDHTAVMVREWSLAMGIRTVVLSPYPKAQGSWRDCGAVLNYGIRASSGEHVLLTHPEVMPGKLSVRRCVEFLDLFDLRIDVADGERLGAYACCKVYYLSPRDQELLDTVDWRDKGALAVRDIEGFYGTEDGGNPDYSHRATDLVATPGFRLKTWESLVFGGCSRETWKRLGGMLETRQWGSVDVGFMHRRQTLGIPNHTCPGDDTIVVHCNHDRPGEAGTHFAATDRDMAKWVTELKDVKLSDASQMVWPTVDNI